MKACRHQTLIHSPTQVPELAEGYLYLCDRSNHRRKKCVRYTNINPKIHNMPTEKIILYGLYGLGILHIPFISDLSHFDSISCRARLRSLPGTAPGPLALRFSLSFSSCRTARLASCVFRSFSFRNALDSNSCQSPSRSLSLQSHVSTCF